MTYEHLISVQCPHSHRLGTSQHSNTLPTLIQAPAAPLRLLALCVSASPCHDVIKQHAQQLQCPYATFGVIWYKRYSRLHEMLLLLLSPFCLLPLDCIDGAACYLSQSAAERPFR